MTPQRGHCLIYPTTALTLGERMCTSTMNIYLMLELVSEGERGRERERQSERQFARARERERERDREMYIDIEFPAKLLHYFLQCNKILDLYDLI